MVCPVQQRPTGRAVLSRAGVSASRIEGLGLRGWGSRPPGLGVTVCAVRGCGLQRSGALGSQEGAPAEGRARGASGASSTGGLARDRGPRARVGPRSLPAGRAPGDPGRPRCVRSRLAARGWCRAHACALAAPGPGQTQPQRCARGFFSPSRAEASVDACVVPGLRLADDPVRHWNSQRGRGGILKIHYPAPRWGRWAWPRVFVRSRAGGRASDLLLNH